MTFDPTITLGTVLTLAGFILGGMAFVYAIRSDVAQLGTRESQFRERLDALETEFKKMTDVLVQIARQDERMRAHESRLEDFADRLGALERHVVPRGIAET